MTKLFVDNKEMYLEKVNKKYLNKEKANVIEVKNGIILPPIKEENKTYDGIFKGGVGDKNNKFITGKQRNQNEKFNYSCYDLYKVNERKVIKLDEEVIFGGIIMDHFGHAILETFSRLWYVVKNKKDKRKIAFIKYAGIRSYHYELLRLMGIDKNRILIIEEPTRFKNVIVPDETIWAWGEYKKEYTFIYDEIRKNVKNKGIKKIYLTRTQLEERYDTNEEYFEEFYRRRGYEILSPEKLPLEEQIAYISGCEELVCTLGTLSHLALFMENGSKLTIFNRTTKNVLEPQIIIDQARKLEVTYIDALLNVLPSPHTAGCVCMYPNNNFKNYLEEEGIEYKQEELDIDKDKFVIEYIKKWSENFSRPNRFLTIAGHDICDVVTNIYNTFNDNKITAKDVYLNTGKLSKRHWNEKANTLAKENEKLKKELEILKEENNILNKKITRIINSKSWKITKPLRYIRKLFKRKHINK